MSCSKFVYPPTWGGRPRPRRTPWSGSVKTVIDARGPRSRRPPTPSQIPLHFPSPSEADAVAIRIKNDKRRRSPRLLSEWMGKLYTRGFVLREQTLDVVDVEKGRQ